MSQNNHTPSLIQLSLGISCEHLSYRGPLRLPIHEINVLEGNRMSAAVGEAICDAGTQTANSNTHKAGLQQGSNII
jgi:hypothetical protein